MEVQKPISFNPTYKDLFCIKNENLILDTI